MHSTKTLQYRKEHYIIQEKGYAHTFSCLVNMPAQYYKYYKNIKYLRHASFSSKLFLLYSLACFNMSKNVLEGKGMESKKKYFFRLQAIPSEQIGRDSETAGEDTLTHVF